MLMAGVSIGQQAHHDPPLAGEKRSFSLNQECQSIIFQVFFSPTKKGVYSHVFSVQSPDRMTVEEDKQTLY